MNSLNPVAQIGDIIRGSILADKPEQIPLLLKSVTDQVTAVGGDFFIKNFWTSKAIKLGYVGVHIKIRVPLPSTTNQVGSDNSKRKYILMELQLHVKEIMDGTADCAKEIAHLLYKAPREAEEKIDSDVISGSQLVYLTAMTKLLATPEDLKRVKDTVQILQAMSKADKKMRLVMETALLLHDEKLEGTWNERLQVVVPTNKEAVATAWMATAQKINAILNIPEVKIDEKEEWVNTATSVDEIYDDAKQITPFFVKLCNQAANSQPGCSVNFGPNQNMIKEKSSLLNKIRSDLGEDNFAVVFHSPISKEREDLMINYIGDIYTKERDFARGYELTFMGKKIPTKNPSKESFINRQELCISARWLTDGDLRLLIDLVPNLRNLTISDCQITGEGLASLFNLPHLNTVSLVNCNALTDDGMANLSQLSHLSIVTISNCSQITGSSLASLNKLKNLEILKISNCKNITYSNLGNLKGLIAARCSIHIEKCSNISGYNLAKFAELSGLSDEECRKIGVTESWS